LPNSRIVPAMDRTRLTLICDWVWLVVLGVVSSLYGGASAQRIGPTFDEPLYVKCGLERWRTGSSYELMRVGTMPLPVDVATLPVGIWERVRGEQFDPTADLGRILPVARMGSLAFWWVLVIYVWLAARRLGGPWAGRLSAALLATEPNLLAHASLATTDMALTAMFLMFCFYFRLGREGSWWKRVAVPALCYAAAVLAKASALTFVPICMVAIEFERLWSESSTSCLWARVKETATGVFSRRNFIDAAVIAAIGWTAVYLYCGSDWQPHDGLMAAAHALPEGTKREVATWAAEHFRVFNNAGVAMWRQIQHNAQGHSVYLLGETAPRAIWYYFPVALSMKTTIPFLLLALGLALLRPRALWNWPCLAAAALLAFSLTCRVQIGIRFFLPLIALACIGMSVALVQACREASAGRRRLVAAAATLLVGWSAIESALVWPNALCFTNELWGGTSRGFESLSDSNYDWGQGLPELADWPSANGALEVAVWYFGTDPAVHSLPFRDVGAEVMASTDERQLRSAVGSRYLAVGTTLLYGSYVNPEKCEILKWLRAQPPIARTQTFLIFDLQGDDSIPKAVAALP
jgi:hypothetical protein